MGTSKGISDFLKQVGISLRFQGLSTTLRRLRYSLGRAWWDAQYGQRKPPHGRVEPGQLVRVQAGARGAVLDFDQARLEVHFLQADLVRLTWTPGEEPVPYAVEPRTWPDVGVRVLESGESVRLSSSALEVQVDSAGAVGFRDPHGSILHAAEPPGRQGEAWHQPLRLRAEECLYGLGQRSAPLNLRGGTYRLWNLDPGGSYQPGDDPLYLTVPLLLGVHRAGSYLLFHENSYRGRVDLGDNPAINFEGGALRYYFSGGPPPRAIENYTTLTGKPPLPPRWSLGYHQSRWGYQTADQIREVVAGFDQHDLPLAAVHLDIDYMDGYRLFTVDEERFPDLASLADELHDRSVKLVVILDCGVKVDRKYGVYREGLASGAFVRLPNGKPLVGLVWPDWSVYPDFTDPEARAWWRAQYRGLLDAGVDGIWHDMNEPTSFHAWGEPTLPDATRHHMEGRGGDHREGRNLYALLMDRAGWEAVAETRPDRRPWLLTRSGWAGVQRYAWHWTGDTASTWEMLGQTVPTVLGLGLSGIGFTGPDIGGFSGAPSEELFIRWFQLACYLPFFRNHAAVGTPDREPWKMGPAVLEACRRSLGRRGQLTPYLYTLAWEASQTGAPPARPLFWIAPEDERLWPVGDSFLLGDALLVAPVLEAGATRRRIRLPEGTWYRFWDGTKVESGTEVEFQVSLDEIPVLARGGSVIPRLIGKRLHLHFFLPEAGPGSGILYSDAGDGYGPRRVDRFDFSRDEGGVTIRWSQQGEYLFPYGEIVLHWHGLQVGSAMVDGGKVTVEGDHLIVGYFERARLEAA